LQAAFVVSRFVRVWRSIKQYPKGEKRKTPEAPSRQMGQHGCPNGGKLAEFTATHKRVRQSSG
jgi:hypothetical protein